MRVCGGYAAGVAALRGRVSVSVGIAGFRFGVAACVSTLAFAAAQSLQLLNVVRFPVDEILIFGTSLCIVIPFLLEMLAFHYATPPDKQFWSHAAVLFATIYAVFVVANYVVQLATVIPARIAGEADGMHLLMQTPHSMFWDYDAVGYIAMGLSALCAIPAVVPSGFERWVRWSLLAHVLATPLICVVYFSSTFSTTLLLLGTPWVLTAPLFMWMIALLLRRRGARSMGKLA